MITPWRYAGGGGGAVLEALGSGPGHAAGTLASGEWRPQGTAESLTRPRTALPQRIIHPNVQSANIEERCFRTGVKGDNDLVQSDQNKIQAISFETCN